MSDYISREEVERFIENGLNNPDKSKAFGHDAVEILTEVHFMDAANVRPVVRGEWLPYEFEIKPYEYGKPLWVKCSVCGKPSRIRNEPYTSKYSGETIMTENILNFCRICGADMRKEVNDG